MTPKIRLATRSRKGHARPCHTPPVVAGGRVVGHVDLLDGAAHGLERLPDVLLPDLVRDIGPRPRRGATKGGGRRLELVVRGKEIDPVPH